MNGKIFLKKLGAVILSAVTMLSSSAVLISSADFFTTEVHATDTANEYSLNMPFYLSEQEAKCFIGFLFNTKELTEEQIKDGNIYAFLTGQLSGEDEINAGFSFIDQMDAQLSRTISKYEYGSAKGKEWLLDYLYSKAESTPNLAEQIVSETLNEICQSGIDYLLEEYTIHGGMLEDMEYDYIQDFQIGKDLYDQITGIPDQVDEYKKIMLAITGGCLYAGGENRRIMYQYFADTKSNMIYKYDYPEGSYELVMSRYELDETYVALRKIQPILAKWDFLDENMLLWATDERIALIEKWADFAYNVEKGLSQFPQHQFDNNDDDENPDTIIETGNCGENGDNVKYTLYNDGLLVISGTGNMSSYQHIYWNGEWCSTSPFSNSKNRKLISEVIINQAITSIGDYAFGDCFALESITIPDSITHIGKCAFDNCQCLTSIIIPNSVTSMGTHIFENSGLTNVILSNKITEIPNGTFVGCKNLTNINIPYNIKAIGSGAFSRTSLSNISIPNSVLSIGARAFLSCSSLTNVYISSSVQSISYDVFGDCNSLIGIDVDKDSKYYSSENGVLFDKSKQLLLRYPCGKLAYYYIVPSEVQYIDGYAFSGCSRLTKIILPDTVRKIGNNAFDYCPNLTIYGFQNSRAEYYAKGNGIPFVELVNNTSVIPATCTAEGKQAYYHNNYDGKNYEDADCTIEITDIDSWGIIPATGRHRYDTPVWEWTKDNGKYYAKMTVDCLDCGSTETVEADVDCTATDNSFVYTATAVIDGQTYQDTKIMKFLENTSELSADEIVVGKSITVTANADGGEGGYTYAVYYKKKAESKWTVKQNFSTDDTVTIKPVYATEYDVCVKVKDSGGTIAKKYFTVKVNSKLSNTSSLSAENIVIGQKVTANCLAQGGMGEYQYQVVYKQTSQSKWTTAQTFSENATVTFKPAKTTTYDVCVKVKDSNGTIVKKFFTVQVNAKLTNTSDVSATEIKKGSTVTVNGSATGGVGDYTYAVYYKQKAQTKWTVKQDFNENSDVSVKPAQATDYDICVKVKDKDGTIAKQYFTVTVTK